jgi:DNA-binding NtrC family response regulator
MLNPLSDGPSLLRVLKASPNDFDLIVTDYAMPLMSGRDMLREAKQIRPDLPAIIISGYADSESIVDEPDEVVVVTKPFTLDQMKAAIRAVLPSVAEALPTS